jgi:hypothetical protein
LPKGYLFCNLKLNLQKVEDRLAAAAHSANFGKRLRRGDVEFLDTSRPLHLKFQLKECLVDLITGDQAPWQNLQLLSATQSSQLWPVALLILPGWFALLPHHCGLELLGSKMNVWLAMYTSVAFSFCYPPMHITHWTMTVYIYII